MGDTRQSCRPSAQKKGGGVSLLKGQVFARAYGMTMYGNRMHAVVRGPAMETHCGNAPFPWQ